MSETTATHEPTETFFWDTPETGKTQFDSFSAHFVQCLGSRAKVLSPADLEMSKPVPPVGERPAGHGSAAQAWDKVQAEFRKETIKLNDDYSAAIALLRKLFPFPSGARTLVDDTIMQRPVEVNAQEWTATKQFPVIMERLTARYSRQTATDTTTLKSQIQALDDQVEGGLAAYEKEFTRMLSQLRATGIPNIDSDAREWVRKGIKNKCVYRHVVSGYITANPNCTYSEIFEQASSWVQDLLLKGDDVYEKVHSNPSSISVNSVIARKRACLRCWRSNHSFAQCTAVACGVCRTSLTAQDATCPNWKSHGDPNLRFRNGIVPAWLKPPAAAAAGGGGQGGKPQAKTSELGKRGRQTQAPTKPSAEATQSSSAAPADFEAVKKAFRVAQKQYRKMKSGMNQANDSNEKA